jgi:hypothetical protein
MNMLKYRLLLLAESFIKLFTEALLFIPGNINSHPFAIIGSILKGLH